MRRAMLFQLQLLLAVVALFGVLAAAMPAPTDLLGRDLICGFANRGDTSSQYTYFSVDECRALGEATPVRNLYRDPKCDCTFYKYVLLEDF